MSDFHFQSFNYMKSRIRKKVELILQSDARLEDNLSSEDLQIHKMSPVVGYQMLYEELESFNDPTTKNDDTQCNSVEINSETIYPPK